MSNSSFNCSQKQWFRHPWQLTSPNSWLSVGTMNMLWLTESWDVIAAALLLALKSNGMGGGKEIIYVPCFTSFSHWFFQLNTHTLPAPLLISQPPDWIWRQHNCHTTANNTRKQCQWGEGEAILLHIFHCVCQQLINSFWLRNPSCPEWHPAPRLNWQTKPSPSPRNSNQ